MLRSSALSDDWISPNWFPGVIPSPSVVNGQLPMMTRSPVPSGLRAIRADWGITPGTRLTSAFSSIQLAQSLASHRAWSRLRNGRSATPPTSPPNCSAGKMRRQALTPANNSHISPKAKSENAVDATSRVECETRLCRRASTTRSLPLFLMSFMEEEVCHIFRLGKARSCGAGAVL